MTVPSPLTKTVYASIHMRILKLNVISNVTSTGFGLSCIARPRQCDGQTYEFVFTHDLAIVRLMRVLNFFKMERALAPECDGTWERSTWLNLSNTVTLWSSASPQFRQTSTTSEDGEGFVFLLKLELSYKRCLKGAETSLFGSIYTEGYRHLESGEPRREIGNMMKSGECCSTDALRFERLGGCKIKLGECKTRF
ncbi:hypothetical protein YC2023_039718 [Brassica napus]